MSINIFNFNLNLQAIEKAASRVNPLRYLRRFLGRSIKRSLILEFNSLEADLLWALGNFWDDPQAQTLAWTLAELSEVKKDLRIGYSLYRGPGMAWEIVNEELRATSNEAGNIRRASRNQDVARLARQFTESLGETKARVERYLSRKEWQ